MPGRVLDAIRHTKDQYRNRRATEPQVQVKPETPHFSSMTGWTGVGKREQHESHPPNDPVTGCGGTVTVALRLLSAAAVRCAGGFDEHLPEARRAPAARGGSLVPPEFHAREQFSRRQSGGVERERCSSGQLLLPIL